jgi:hypothetical protein
MVLVTVAFLCLCSSLLHVSSLLCSLFFSRYPASSASFLHPPLVAFLCGLLCFFEKKQGNESLLWFLSVPLLSFSSVSLRLLRSLFSTVRGSFFVSPVFFFLVLWSPVSGFFALLFSPIPPSFPQFFLPCRMAFSCPQCFFFPPVPLARLPLPGFL